jgi:hypothetical protein
MSADIGSVPPVRASARKPLPVDPVTIGVSNIPTETAGTGVTLGRPY